MKTDDSDLLFDYRTLRLIIGLVALSLPAVVIVLSSTPLTSISASYYTEARDVFVGILFVIGALFLAYKGRGYWENAICNFGAVAAFLAAVFPTTCNDCGADWKSNVHYVAAGVLFFTTAYLCFFVLNKRADQKKSAGKRGPERRRRFYIVCGSIILACIAAAALSQLTVPIAIRKTMAITFYAELVALWAFGTAWLVASKVFKWFVEDEDPDEQLVLVEPGAMKGIAEQLRTQV